MEADLQELWADAPLAATKPGWDPVWADEEDWEIVEDELREGKDPPIAPFYLPYRKPYPVIPDNHYDISTPKAVVEELDRIEEFLKWVSFIFADGSSYEGTVWDDLDHGKGVYVAEQGLVRYEGEWLQNNMEGHGVAEVDIPDIEPIPGSKLEAQMRAEGKIITRDFMNPEDREWLEMNIEDSVRLIDVNYEIPYYENDEWTRQFGRKPDGLPKLKYSNMELVVVEVLRSGLAIVKLASRWDEGDLWSPSVAPLDESIASPSGEEDAEDRLIWKEDEKEKRDEGRRWRATEKGDKEYEEDKRKEEKGKEAEKEIKKGGKCGEG
ncbi:hypothetical protein KSS87_010603 [Heliosperma pusillum]|nr:hypothetical protein KSS87_010603 [Heliosperma pusillum]